MADISGGLAREIFGGSDSELSEDDNYERPTKPNQRHDESTGGESDEEYANESRVPKGKTVRRKKSVRATTGTKRKRRAPKKEEAVEPVDLDSLPPEQAAKLRIAQKIDDILKPKKSRRPKKRKNEEVLDSFADDQVARLRETMNNAADEDIRSNQEKLPATVKLRLLPEVMDVLRKASLAQSMIDNNLLEGVRRWLEPLPDSSLPSLNIQKEFFSILPKMEFIDSSVLKESGLGRVVMFYTKSNRITPEIQRTANELVMTWARPIIKRSASYRDKVVPLAAIEMDGRAGGEKLQSILARKRDEEKLRVKKNTVAVPRRDLGNYTIAPKSNLQADRTLDADSERRRQNNARLKSLKSRLSSQNK